MLTYRSSPTDPRFDYRPVPRKDRPHILKHNGRWTVIGPARGIRTPEDHDLFKEATIFCMIRNLHPATTDR